MFVQPNFVQWKNIFCAMEAYILCNGSIYFVQWKHIFRAMEAYISCNESIYFVQWKHIFCAMEAYVLFNGSIYFLDSSRICSPRNRSNHGRFRKSAYKWQQIIKPKSTQIRGSQIHLLFSLLPHVFAILAVVS